MSVFFVEGDFLSAMLINALDEDPVKSFLSDKWIFTEIVATYQKGEISQYLL